MLRGRHKHIFKSQWYFLLSSQLLFLGPFVFHGPFVLESIGLLVKPTVAASLIGSFLVMLTSLVGVPLIVDRFGARKMALISVFALSISQVLLILHTSLLSLALFYSSLHSKQIFLELYFLTSPGSFIVYFYYSCCSFHSVPFLPKMCTT
ncbi:unnamed protein product [Cuscuta epithymum]|uniref:Major facilitator superfamily (MFS) profile domain-containing protein n=1 Tax=Cuscuta epithymum TaxID=186058 RepID=A0AAV0CII3_9ASTE|nr:unnamed protein product [Cuscuta epithymum]